MRLLSARHPVYDFLLACFVLTTNINTLDRENISDKNQTKMQHTRCNIVYCVVCVCCMLCGDIAFIVKFSASFFYSFGDSRRTTVPE